MFSFGEYCQILWTAFIEHLWRLLLKISYWTPPQNFFYLKECVWTFQIFYSEKYIPVWLQMSNTSSYQQIYHSAGREGIFNNWKHEILNMKSLLNANLYTWSTFISHLACLGKSSNSWYKYLRPFLINTKNPVVSTEFPMFSKCNCSQLKIYFIQFFDKFLN